MESVQDSWEDGSCPLKNGALNRPEQGCGLWEEGGTGRFTSWGMAGTCQAEAMTPPLNK